MTVLPRPAECAHSKIEQAREFCQNNSLRLSFMHARLVFSRCMECGKRVLYVKNDITGELNVTVIEWNEVK